MLPDRPSQKINKHTYPRPPPWRMPRRPRRRRATFPGGARLHRSDGHDELAKQIRPWLSLPTWLKRPPGVESRSVRVKGVGLVDRATGVCTPSLWRCPASMRTTPRPPAFAPASSPRRARWRISSRQSFKKSAASSRLWHPRQWSQMLYAKSNGLRHASSSSRGSAGWARGNSPPA